MTGPDLRNLRIELGLTQAQMADRLGISRRQYGIIEDGEEVRPVYVLAVERVALAEAAARRAPMLAPASVRKAALTLAAVITEG